MLRHRPGRGPRAALRAALPALGLLAGLGGLGGAATATAASPPPDFAGQVRAAEMPALEAIAVPAAWRVSRGRGITVGVLDTGVGAGAPDLAGSVTQGPDYTLGVDPPGYQPPHLHGTFISSLIAGHGSGPGRSGGVIGVAPAARVLSVRVLPDDQEPGLRVYNDNPKYDNAVAKGVRYAVGHGVRVINMSLGSTTPSRGLRAAIAYAVAHNVVVVAAAGNNGSGRRRFSPYSYPASYPGVIAVAAVTNGGRRAPFSDHNASVVIAAPGVNVVGAAPNGNYLQASGTSPASALVAGVATLIRSAYPRLQPALVAQAIIASARHRPAHGYSPDLGFGLVNAPAALRAAGRLAALRPATGLTPAARVAAAQPGPIQVVHRNAARILTFGGLSAMGILGFLAALSVLIVLARRSLHDRRAYAGGLPAGQWGYPGAGLPRGSGYPGSAPPPSGAGYPGPVPPPPGYRPPVPPPPPGSGYPGIAPPPPPGSGYPGTAPPPPPGYRQSLRPSPHGAGYPEPAPPREAGYPWSAPSPAGAGYPGSAPPAGAGYPGSRPSPPGSGYPLSGPPSPPGRNWPEWMPAGDGYPDRAPANDAGQSARHPDPGYQAARPGWSARYPQEPYPEDPDTEDFGPGGPVFPDAGQR